MITEKQKLLDKINKTIMLKRDRLLSKLPQIHKVSDGIAIRFFSTWENCRYNNNIKFKNITDDENSNERLTFFYIPKDTIFTVESNYDSLNIICLDGFLEVDNSDSLYIMNSFTKKTFNGKNFQGKALENSYVLTSNNILP